MKKGVILSVCILICATIAGWYVYSHVHFVTKEEKRMLVVSEVTKALERYYDEHGRYPVVDSNEALMHELSAKKYFDTEVRIDVVRYVPINNGQTYTLQ